MDMKKHFELSMQKLLKEKCIDKITINELIDDVGSCKGTFYKYYIDKYDLCYKCLLNNVYSKINFNETDWQLFLVNFIKVFSENSKVIYNAFDSTDINSTRHYNERMLSEVISSLLQSKGVDVNDKFVRFTLESSGIFITSVFYYWMKNGKKESIEELCEMIRSIIPQSIYNYVYPQS